MKTHNLKTVPPYFQQVQDGKKKFELRKNDRDYAVGDYLKLEEFDGKLTGRTHVTVVLYLLKDCPEYGLKDGYCILGIR